MDKCRIDEYLIHSQALRNDSQANAAWNIAKNDEFSQTQLTPSPAFHQRDKKVKEGRGDTDD